MKKKLLMTSIILLATSVQAESELMSEIPAALEISPASTQIMPSTADSLMLSEKGNSISNLWEILDIDRDGFLSKAEAAASKDVSENWDSLDTNQDEKIDSKEFVNVFSQQD